ncbi:MAG: lipase family protein [Bdellovibrionales bacterium]|nr:lipase family protein [Bdellovibrionales bacterium]
MKILKNYLPYQDQKTNVMYFLPEVGGETLLEIKPTFALLTHGYTADKSSIINWAIRLSEVGVSCALFDLPGHYQGNYSEVNDFEFFKCHAHELFFEAFKGLSVAFKEEFPLNEQFLEPSQLKIAFCGHSLGAMLSLKAIIMPEFEKYEKRALSVGLGMAPKNVVHLFDTPFYKSTLKVREQLVSPELKPDNVFPWIKEEKNLIEIRNQDIHLITGEDDLVVGSDGMERFQASLEQKNNRVTIERPSKLPHHEPALAASHVKKYLKKINWI